MELTIIFKREFYVARFNFSSCSHPCASRGYPSLAAQ